MVYNVIRDSLSGEYMERVNSWWADADFPMMEKVTGYRQSCFSPEEGYQDFVDACDEWWAQKTAIEKLHIFEEHNN